jgi:hypothetical protein
VTALAVIATAELVLIGFLMWERRRSSADYIALIDRLCQRLQAPAAAVLEHDEQVRARRGEEYAPPAVEPDDDEGYWLSRDKLADLAMKAEQDERAAA